MTTARRGPHLVYDVASSQMGASMDEGFSVDIDELYTAATRLRQLTDVVPSDNVQLLHPDDYGDPTLVDAGRDFAARWGRAMTVLGNDLTNTSANLTSCADDYEATDGDVKAGLMACTPALMG